MERSSFGVSLKDRSIVTREIEGDQQGAKKNLMSFWGCSAKENYQEEDYLNGFSWPPRSYTCSFCKREFKSAQALGGHMNVHRRDRARLRQSPPLEGEQNLPQPNPNLNSFSTFSTKLDPSPNPLSSLISIPLLSLSSSSSSIPSEIKKFATIKMKVPDTMKTQNEKPAFEVGEDAVRLEKAISFLGDSKEDLDLELRLGYL